MGLWNWCLGALPSGLSGSFHHLISPSLPVFTLTPHSFPIDSSFKLFSLPPSSHHIPCRQRPTSFGPQSFGPGSVPSGFPLWREQGIKIHEDKEWDWKERHLQDIKNLSRSFIKLNIFFDSSLWIELHHKNNPLPSLILTLISNQGAWVETLGNRWGGVCHLAASTWRTLILHSNRISHDSALHFVSTCQLLCPLTYPSLSRRSLD